MSAAPGCSVWVRTDACSGSSVLTIMSQVGGRGKGEMDRSVVVEVVMGWLDTTVSLLTAAAQLIGVVRPKEVQLLCDSLLSVGRQASMLPSSSMTLERPEEASPAAVSTERDPVSAAGHSELQQEAAHQI